MSAIEIPCPQCSMKLRLPDRSLLGRKGKCGKCGHKFLLEEPVNLDSAEPDEGGADSANQTLVGNFVKFVGQPPVTSGYPQVAQRQPAPQPYSSPAIPSYPTRSPPAAAAVMESPHIPEVLVPEAEAEQGGVARLRALQKKNAHNRNIAIGIGLAVLVACTVTYFMLSSAADEVAQESKKRRKTARAATPAAAAAEVEDAAAQDTRANGASPTHGEPITLLLVPNGTRVVINVRPSRLWEAGGLAEEFRYCLGPLAIWVEAQLKELCLTTDLTTLDEVMICLIPARKGSPPDVAVVVHTKDDFRKSDLLEKFNGELVDDAGRPHYVGTDRAYMIYDQRTYATCPASMAEEMVQAADNPSITVDGIIEMLNKSDRDRDFTIVFEPIAARIDAPFLAPQNAQNLLNSMLDWFGDDVEAVAWSCHLGEEFFSELLLRNQGLTSPPKLQRIINKQLEQTPRDILEIVRKTNPQEQGRRQIVGRFPAMTKQYALSTKTSTGNRLVALQTVLPERAAPNLALGALLAWDQTTRPDYGKTSTQPAGTPKSSGPKLPDLLADRLKKKIDVDFRNDPLHGAISYIEEETGAKFKIEGNDLKMVGVTQNMKQQFKMDQVPATAVLHHMLDKLGLVIIVDEEKKIVTVTSAKAAEDKGLTPFPLAPASP